MKAIARSVGPVGNITLILSVVMYIFAVLGIKVFGKAYTPDKFGEDGVPRWNFNDFWHAIMMVFRVLCGEWIEPLWDCMRATSAAKATLFFLSVLVVGNFIVSSFYDQGPITKRLMSVTAVNTLCHSLHTFEFTFN